MIRAAALQTPVPPEHSPSTLPDYYGDERQARRRVRVRHSLLWVAAAVGVAGLAEALRLMGKESEM